jgi:hypothetical protein
VAIRTPQHAHPQHDIIARAKLVHQPTQAMRLVAFVAGHHRERAGTETTEIPRERYRATQHDMLGLAISMGDRMRINVFAPGTMDALGRPL